MEHGNESRSNISIRRAKHQRHRGIMICYNIFVILVSGILLFLSNGVVVDEFSAQLRQGKRRSHFISADTKRTKKVHHKFVLEPKSRESPAKDLNLSIVSEKSGQSDPLKRSKEHQRKFDTQRQLLEHKFGKTMRYYVDLFEFGANIVNEEYAYIHIFKNGGTTIEVQTGHDHTSIRDPQVQKRKWFTFVRDPIDHFLSGWAECFHRMQFEKNHTVSLPINTTVEESYDLRVNEWIDAVTALARPDIKAACEIHSFPQANSLLDPGGHIPTQLEIVGDLSELPAILAQVRFNYNPTIESGRNSTANSYLQTFFPKRKDWLSYKTKRRLCHFLAMDYFLFDFEMPPACTRRYTKTKKEVVLSDSDVMGLQNVEREQSPTIFMQRKKNY